MEGSLPLAISKVPIDIQPAQRPFKRIDRPVPVLIELLEMFMQKSPGIRIRGPSLPMLVMGRVPLRLFQHTVVRQIRFRRHDNQRLQPLGPFGPTMHPGSARLLLWSFFSSIRHFSARPFFSLDSCSLGDRTRFWPDRRPMIRSPSRLPGRGFTLSQDRTHLAKSRSCKEGRQNNTHRIRIAISDHRNFLANSAPRAA